MSKASVLLLLQLWLTCGSQKPNPLPALRVTLSHAPQEVPLGDKGRGRAKCASTHALRVATAGGTDAALRAGPYTAIWPSSHSSAAPTGR